MKIFSATANEGEILTALDHSRPFSAHWTLAGWQAQLAQPAGRVWCAKQEGKIVGFVALRGAYEQYELLNLAVAAGYTRLGVASALIDHAFSVLAGQGVQQISLEVSTANQPAQGLYLKKGFRIIGVRKKFYEDGSDGLIMEKEL